MTFANSIKGFLFLSLLVFSPNRSFAQKDFDYFKNYSPVWAKIPTPETNPYRANLYYSQSLMNGEDLYVLYRYFPNMFNNIKTGLSTEYDGGCLIKLNINTGEQLWEYHYDLRTIPLNESPSEIYFDSSGYINIIGKQLTELDTNNNHSLYSTFTRKTIDPNTGILVDSFYTNRNDSSKIDRSYTRYYSINDNEFVNIIGHGIDNYLGLRRFNKWNKTLRDTTIDFKVNYPYRYINFGSLNKVRDDTTFIYEIQKRNWSSDDTTQCDVFLLRFDKNLNILDSMNLKKAYNLSGRFQFHGCRWADKDFTTMNVIDEPTPFDWKYYFKFFDYKGNFIDQMETGEIGLVNNAMTRSSEDEFMLFGGDYTESAPYKHFKIFKKK